jgi:hypothetical protein
MNVKDKRISLGKRKKAFVAWLIKQGVSPGEARLICYKKFYHETIEEQWAEHNRLLDEYIEKGRCVCGMALNEHNQLKDHGLKGIECSMCS